MFKTSDGRTTRDNIHICKVLVLRANVQTPRLSDTLHLGTKASDTAGGAVHRQEFDDRKFPMAYLIMKLLPREHRESMMKKECLALVWAVKNLSIYLIGREFIVETDHAPLLCMNKTK
ncbi:retrovirus-related pol polyprotein from transposon 297 [Plakobranchus ocellatus]|uniref:Retrovirus-related pol polyprotein from transposon 297 n=1 Tax=Plakobranchus ocellatus TaxID=259542 RepID=A0AAV3YLA8_9GAST|nr:retrovirus-related pol polyprotein from transposon 297 [Plakobranchus ocellatus]